jgi:hypothetical protein
MNVHSIVNEIDNAENETELQETLSTIVQDITAQVMAAHSAVNDNPNVGRITLEDLCKSIAAAVQSEYLDPGSVLD